MSEVEASAAATDAATVVVLRPAEPGFEVFMVRRHSDSGFMGDRYVYPGGKLDETDCTDRVLDHVTGMSPEEARVRLDEEIAPLRALGLFLAGVRETFEEAGLLLARRSGEEAFVDLVSNAETAETFGEARRALASGELSISAFVDEHDLVVPLERIGYFAHWITPHVEERRYDTRFFVVAAPRHQKPLHDEHETTDSGWFRPAEIVERNRREELKLAPPTLRTLQRLVEFDSVDDVLEFARSYRPPTLLPHMEAIDGDLLLLLPGDPEYPAEAPEYAVAEATDAEVTRLRMVDRGLWETV